MLNFTVLGRSEHPRGNPASTSIFLKTHLHFNFSMKLRVVYVILGLFTSLLVFNKETQAQTALTLGDVAFVGYQSDNPDIFSIVLLTDITTGTTISFTENGWFAAGGFRTGEGTCTYTANDNLTCGTEITIQGLSASNNGGFTAGTMSGSSLALSASGDQVFAYQTTVPTAGNQAPFLAAIQMNGAWDADATSANTSAKPTVFTDGVNSISISPEVDNAVYNCAVNGPGAAAIRPAVNNSANWTTSGGLGLSFPPNCSFACASISVTTGVIAGAPFCVTASTGAPVTVPFTSIGTFNPGNIYTAWLSDATGSFAAPTNIGTLASTANSGNIAATIPAGTPSGTMYRIRVDASDPATTGSPNVSDFEIILGVPDVNTELAVPNDMQVDVSWALPTGCYDEIFVFAKAGGSLTNTPTGDGTAYTANATFGSGTDMGGGEYCVYKSTATSVSVTGLTNGTNYCFKIWCRKGTDWSAGVEVCQTPNPSSNLSRGDLAILAVNGNNGACSGNVGEDEISFVCFRDITSGFAIDFTDNGWERCNAGQWGNTEGAVQMTRTGGTITAGTVITFRVHNGVFTGISPDNNWTFNSLSTNGGTFAINNGGDQIYFMQGGTWNDGTASGHNATYTGGTVLFGFSTNATWVASCGTNPTQNSNMYAGLECFTMAPTGSTDYNKYTGPTTAVNQGSWLGRINNTGNWTSYADCATYNAAVPDYAGGYTISIAIGGFSPGRWLGTNSSDWFDCSNWENLQVPDQTVDVQLPNSGVVNECVVNLPGAECHSFTIKSARTMTINGTGNLDVYDGWTNDGTFTHTAGSVTFRSTAAILGGANQTDFFNVIMNKDAATDDMTLNNIITIANSATFTLGNFNSTAAFYPSFLAGSSVVGVNNSSFVDGPVEKVGNTAFVFPTGDAADYQPIAISNVTGGATNAFTAEYFQVDPHPTYDENLKDITINLISSCEYWTLDQSNGTPTAEVTLAWDANSCGVTVLCDLLVARWDGAMWKDHGNGGTTGVAAAGTVVSGINCITPANVTTFSPFTLASATPANPLPVNLLDYSAKYVNEEVELSWSTASETDNAFFTIERSTDGTNFEFVLQMPANNGNEVMLYQDRDDTPPSGLVYYRLSQTDENGETERLRTESVLVPAHEGIEYVNVTDGMLNFGYSSDFDFTLEVIDLTGRAVETFRVNGAEGFRHQLNLQSLSKGIYTIRVIDGMKLSTSRIKL